MSEDAPRRKTAARRLRDIAIITALCLIATLGSGAAYLALVKHYRLSTFRFAFRSAWVRAYLFEPQLRQLLDEVSEQRDADTFAAVWDTNERGLLSKRLFEPVEMFGQSSFRYRPNISKLGFKTGARGVRFSMETEDTPRIRQLLAGLETELLAAASYDANRRRRTAPAFDDCASRAIFLGDSFTDGPWVENPQTFASLFAVMARARGRALCSINAGVNGHGTIEEAWILEHDFLDLRSTDSLFVMFYPNDIDVDYRKVVEGQLVAEAGWREATRYLARIARFAMDRHAPFYLVPVPTSQQVRGQASTQYYQDPLAAFAQQEHITYLDPLPALKHANRTPDHLYFGWDPHLTPAGHQAMSEFLAGATLGAVSPVRRSSPF